MKGLFLLLVCTVFLSGCFENGHASDSSQNHVQGQNGIKLAISLNKQTYDPEEDILVHVEATNEEETPVEYVGYNGCDPGISVQSTGYQRVKKPGEPDFCIETIVNRTLKPHDTLLLDVTLRPPSKISSGSHTVQVVFQRGTRSQHIQASIPFDI